MLLRERTRTRMKLRLGDEGLRVEIAVREMGGIWRGSAEQLETALQRLEIWVGRRKGGRR
jgi:hypothetical protein